MEHIYTPSGVSHLEIPYLCTTESPYSGNDFFQYPQRYTVSHSWTNVNLAAEEYGSLSSEEVEAFLLSWLYFGVIVEFFRVGDVEVDLEKFINKEKDLITTAELRKYLRRWNRNLERKRQDQIGAKRKELKEKNATEIKALEAQIEKLAIAEDNGGEKLIKISELKKRVEELGNKERYAHDMEEYAVLMGDHHASINNPDYKRVDAIISHLHKTITKHIGGSKSTANPPREFPVPWTVITSMISLASTLWDTALRTFHIEAFRPTKKAWPVSPVLVDMMASKGFCRMSAARLAEHVDHEAIYYAAVAMQPQKNNIQIGLGHENCTERMCKAGNINESTYRFKHDKSCGGECSFVNVDVADVIKVINEEKTPVLRWVEGDNEVAGKLVVRTADKVDGGYVAISHVWSDGMGNPNDNALPICTLRDIQMRVDKLYERSRQSRSHKTGHDAQPDSKGDSQEKPTEVNPPEAFFWMDTLCVPVQDDNVQYRKKTILRMGSIYHDSDKVLVLDSWLREMSYAYGPIEEIVLRTFMCDWSHRLWTLQEGVLPQRPYLQLSDRALPFKRLSNLAYEICKDKEKRGYSLKWPNIAMTDLTHNMDWSLFGSMLSTHKRGGADHASKAFAQRMKSAHHRRTTRRADETLCMATLMRMDVEKLLDIGGKGDELADRRMVWFLTEVQHFDGAIIFHDCERLPKDGFRWAPRTLLTGRPWDLQQGPVNDAIGGGQYHWDRKYFSCSYPGLTDIRVRSKAGRIVILEAKCSSNSDSLARRYSLEMKANEKGDFYIWDRLCEHGVVVQAVRMTDLIVGKPAKAPVGMFTTPKDGGRMTALRAENCASIELLPEDMVDEEIGGLAVVKCKESDREIWNIK